MVALQDEAEMYKAKVSTKTVALQCTMQIVSLLPRMRCSNMICACTVCGPIMIATDCPLKFQVEARHEQAFDAQQQKLRMLLAKRAKARAA